MNNDFDVEVNFNPSKESIRDKREVRINKVLYRVSDDTAALVHALMCVDATLEDSLEIISNRLNHISESIEENL